LVCRVPKAGDSAKYSEGKRSRKVLRRSPFGKKAKGKKRFLEKHHAQTKITGILKNKFQIPACAGMTSKK
jgi:hypothetical protein